MKKVFSILLASALMLSCLALSACKKEPEPTPAPDAPHTHTFSEEWSTSATEHWHACTGKDCTEVADKTTHSWDAGVITTQPTEDKQGVKTFTCKGCGKIKTAPSDYVGDPDDLEQDQFDPDEDLGEDPFTDLT